MMRLLILSFISCILAKPVELERRLVPGLSSLCNGVSCAAAAVQNATFNGASAVQHRITSVASHATSSVGNSIGNIQEKITRYTVDTTYSYACSTTGRSVINSMVRKAVLQEGQIYSLLCSVEGKDILSNILPLNIVPHAAPLICSELSKEVTAKVFKDGLVREGLFADTICALPNIELTKSAIRTGITIATAVTSAARSSTIEVVQQHIVDSLKWIFRIR